MNVQTILLWLKSLTTLATAPSTLVLDTARREALKLASSLTSSVKP